MLRFSETLAKHVALRQCCKPQELQESPADFGIHLSHKSVYLYPYIVQSHFAYGNFS